MTTNNPEDSATILVACGGTGGHVYPGIALAQGLPRYSFVFIGSKTRQDSRIIPKYGYPFFSISASPRNVIALLVGFFQSLSLIRKFKPKVVLGTGSYHTIPVVFAAKVLGYPIILLEQNAIPGRVNRLLSRFAASVCVSFEESKRFFPKGTLCVTGNPIRRDFAKDDLSFDAVFEGLTGKPFVLVFGGSQGAEAINVVSEALYLHSEGADSMIFIHISGRVFFEKRYGKQPFVIVRDKTDTVRAIVIPYTENMKFFYEKASAVVSRSGATTIAELLHFKKTAVLVPYPHATDNHQLANAEAFCREGSGLILSETELTESRLLADITFALTLPFPDINKSDAVTLVQRQIEDVIKGD